MFKTLAVNCITICISESVIVTVIVTPRNSVHKAFRVVARHDKEGMKHNRALCYGKTIGYNTAN